MYNKNKQKKNLAGGKKNSYLNLSWIWEMKKNEVL